MRRAIIGVLVLVGVASMGSHPIARASHQARPDAVCGPRCVAFVLSYYGKANEELMDLAREIQGDSLEEGSSFAELQGSLEQRGIHCRLARVGRWEPISWPEPVILHVDGSHFVVLQETDGLRVNVWWGLPGSRELSWPRLWARMSRSVLLTSAQPIDPRAKFTAVWPRRLILVASAALAAVGIVLMRQAYLRWRRPADWAAPVRLGGS